MTAFRRRNGWAAKFELDGEQVWVKGSPFETKRQAEEAERRERDRRLARRTNETCASFTERWLSEWPRKAPGTRRTYAAAVRRFAREFGPTPLGDVQRLSARTWALSVPRGISRVVGIMYEDARNVGLVEANPFSNLRLPANERDREIRCPSMAEYRDALDACTVLGGYASEFRAMLQFSVWTGVRAGELHALRWEDVGESTIEVRHSRQRDKTLTRPKNGNPRTIAFLPPARVLEDVPRRPDPYVFHAPRGQVLVQGSHHYYWRQVRAAAGITDIRWHDWRHLCATQLLELGLDHFAVSVQLGHTDGGKLVMERYGHPSEDAARRRLLAAFDVDASEIRSRAVAGEDAS